MSDPEHTPMDPEAEAAMLEALARDLAAMPARIKRAREVEQTAIDAANKQRGQLALERQEHDRFIDDSTAKHQAKCAERERELRVRESALAERERAADEKFQRGVAMIRTAEARAADLGNRERSSA
jgi:predicted glycoside hydrolase/deacetylase ChbG (UPF0249 family)